MLAARGENRGFGERHPTGAKAPVILRVVPFQNQIVTDDCGLPPKRGLDGAASVVGNPHPKGLGGPGPHSA